MPFDKEECTIIIKNIKGNLMRVEEYHDHLRRKIENTYVYNHSQCIWLLCTDEYDYDILHFDAGPVRSLDRPQYPLTGWVTPRFTYLPMVRGHPHHDYVSEWRKGRFGKYKNHYVRMWVEGKPIYLYADDLQFKRGIIHMTVTTYAGSPEVQGLSYDIDSRIYDNYGMYAPGIDDYTATYEIVYLEHYGIWVVKGMYFHGFSNSNITTHRHPDELIVVEFMEAKYVYMEVPIPNVLKDLIVSYCRTSVDYRHPAFYQPEESDSDTESE